jgi:phage baseplate assembly protein V
MLMMERGAGGVGSPGMNDLERRSADSIKFGVVREVDYSRKPPSVRVAIGDEEDDEGCLLTGWLQFGGGRARGDSEWHPPEEGEKVVVLSESGEVQNGIVLPLGLYSDDDPAPGDKAGLWRKSFADGAKLEYDRDSGELTFEAMSKGTVQVGDATLAIVSGSITMTVGGVSLQISSSGVAISGGSVSHDGKNVGKDHRHSGVQAGGAQTGAPV